MSTPTPAPERSSVSTPGEKNVAFIASTANSTALNDQIESPSPLVNPNEVDGAATIKSGGVPLTAWQSSAAELAQLLMGKQLGPFQIEASLGTGGMAAVFRAYDQQLDRKVALKILPPVLAAHPEHVQRFEREAKVTAKLDDDHVARVHQYGQDQGLHYIAYEFVEGTNLRDLMALQGGHLPVDDAVRYVYQAAKGLAHTAARGVIHRDIKPSNLVVTAEGKVKLVDLGLARNCLPEESQDLTHSGATLGTFDYLAPEQAIDPRSADVRSDIYSLGCTLYHCLTGKPPVPQGTAARKLHSHQLELPTDPRELNPSVTAAIVDVLSRMLAKHPEDRYQTADELVRELSRFVNREVTPSKVANPMLPPDQPPSSWMTWVVSLIVLLGAILALDWGWNTWQAHQRMAPTNFVAAATQEPKGAIHPADLGQSTTINRQPLNVVVRTTQELKKILGESKGGTITLQGSLFDIDASDPEGILKITGGTWEVRPAEGFSPLIRLGSHQGRQGLFEVQSGNLQIYQCRLELVDPDDTLLQVHPSSRVTLRDCELIQPEHTGRSEITHSGAVVCLLPRTSDTNPATILFQGCLLHGGEVGLDLQAMGLIQLEDCWVGAFRQLARFPLVADPVTSQKRVVSLTRCCVLQPREATFYVAGDSPTLIEVDKSIFSWVEPGLPFAREDSVWLLQEGSARVDVTLNGSVFHRIPAWYGITTPDGRSEILAREFHQFKTAFPALRETGSILASRSPWLEARPWRRFQESKNLHALLPHETHRSSSPNTLLGQPFRSSTLVARSTPPGPMPSPKGARVLIVDGRGEAAGTFTTVNSALGSITDEEETTVIVQLQGTVPIKPMELGNSRVILKAGEGVHPTFVFHRDTVSGPEGDTSLFRVHDGEIQLENLKVRLEPLRDPARLLSLVSISGTGKCRLKECIVTLKTGLELSAALCVVTDPTGMMTPTGGRSPRTGVARLELADCFVRGTGELLHVLTSRPFSAQGQNCGVVLDGSAIVVEGNRADMNMPAEQAQLALDRSTIHAAKGLLQLRGTPSFPQLVALRCQVTQCMLSTGESHPLIRVETNQSDVELRRKLGWIGRRNCYAVPGPLLIWQSFDRDAMASRYDPTLWSEAWGAEDEQAQMVKSITYQGTGKSIPFAEWEPSDLVPKLDLPGIGLRDVGMLPDQLPQLQYAP
jgi:serine/threonine protein kinase